MPSEAGTLADPRFLPATPDRWKDLERLFGPSGAGGGCWCMWFRLRRKDWDKGSGNTRKKAMKANVERGRVPGLLAYVDGEPVGWVSMAPREEFPHLEHSRTLKRVDDTHVWSIVCFVVDERFRRQGLMGRLLSAAIRYARDQGAEVLESYPVEPGETLNQYDGYTGILSTFRQAGFVEVARPKKRQAIMRLVIEKRRQQ
jgi:GNAT superfamily N-acetyltransferase